MMGLARHPRFALLAVLLQNGTQHSSILRPASPEFTTPLEASKLKVAADYWRMGTIHILEGVDHLLFVLALLFIVLLKKLPISAPQCAWRLMPYSIGGIAAYWTIDRVISFLPLA